MRTARLVLAMFCLTMAAGCTVPDWMGGPEKKIKRAPGERLTVIVTQPSLTAEAAALDTPIEIPPQIGNDQWLSRNEAMLTGHIGLTGLERQQSSRIGDGNDFSRITAPSPVVAGGLVYAMDAAGIISAHEEQNIAKLRWTSSAGEEDDVNDVLGGGIAVSDGVLYAATGYGKLIAMDATTGQTKWSISVGAPVRGAPAVGSGIVTVLTADNQTLAFTVGNGVPRWEHRGIGESAGYFATTSPVISEGILIAAYTSGEIFAIRAETGSVLWSDSVTSQVKTRASAIFSGIDADPIVQDGVVVVVSAGGVMQASALLNGRPLWQQKVASHQTPWSAGNAVFVLSDTHDIAALLKRDGGVRWATSMASDDGKKDTTPPLYGPILGGNAVMVIDGAGMLHTYKPETGEKLGEYELASDIVTPPVIAGGALYVVTKDANLHKYY